MKKVFTIFALAVMFFFCGSILLRFTVKNVLVDNGVENKWTDIVFFDVIGTFLGDNIFKNASFWLLFLKKSILSIGVQVC